MPGALEHPLPALNDSEGESVPRHLPPVIDAHIHLFPDTLFASIWKWFAQHGWPIRYQLGAAAAMEFLLSRGIEHIVAMQYAHKPGVARTLNRFMAELCAGNPRVSGMASVFPGEADTAAILEEGFALGLSGVKLHAHVQCFDMASAAMEEIYETCPKAGRPIVVHAGREPKSPAYACDPYALCSAGRVEQVLRDFPGLRICVPHLGADEFPAYQGLLHRYDNLWLDTTMMLADYLPMAGIPPLSAIRSDRVMYGTDFPHIPYAWDRELKRIATLDLPPEALARILSQNAREFFGISERA